MTLHLKKKLGIQLRRYLFTRMPCKNISALIGLSREKLKLFFECQFSEGMSWENYSSIWHIDHIVPLDCFEDAETALAWHFLNLRPMLVKTNKSKGASLLEAEFYLKRMSGTLPDNTIISALIAKTQQSSELSDLNFLKSFV